MLYLAENFLSLFGLVGVLYLTGWLGDQVLFRGHGLAPYPIAARFGLGSALWMGLVFALASTQQLRRSTLGLIALLILVVAWRLRRRSAATPAPRPRGRPQGDGWAAWALLVGVAAFVLVLWLQNLWPRISWDADAYHLTVPRLYLEHAGFYRIPFNVYSNWPLNLQLLFVLALAARDYVLAKALHLAFGLATLLLVGSVAGRAAGTWAAGLAAALLLVNPVVLDEMRAAYVDLALAFFFLLAFLFVHQALEDGSDRHRRLLLAGVFAGVAAGIKPTGATVIVCVLAVYLFAAWRQGRGAARLLRDSARIAIPAGLLLLPWMAKSWVLTGNPVYPFLYRWLGGGEWSQQLGSRFGDWQQGIGMGRSAVDYLLLPYRVIVAGGPGYETFDGRISPLWLGLIPLALVLGRGRPLVSRSLGAVALYFGLWALSSQQMRFLIPILPLLALAGALGVAAVVERFDGRVRSWFRGSVSLATLVTLLIVSSPMLVPTARMLDQYLERGSEVRDEAVHPVYAFIDDHLPAEARLLFLNTNHGFFCHRDFIADSFFEASQINDLLQSTEDKTGVRAALAELGITHLLVENRDRYVPWPRTLYEFLNDPAMARRVYRSPDNVYDVVEVIGARGSQRVRAVQTSGCFPPATEEPRRVSTQRRWNCSPAPASPT